MLRSKSGVPGGDWSDYAALEPVRAHTSRHECVMLPLRALLAALDAGGSTDRGS
jgi:NifU-like protein involved in Fe-S cluster formation